MAPSVSAGEAAFFTETDYSGDRRSYKIGDDINFFPGKLNDHFKSAIIASDTKVLAWQQDNSSGIYKELEGENSSLTAIGGLSHFKVINSETKVIAFKFTDYTGGAAKQYALKLYGDTVGQKTFYSDEDDEFKLVDLISESEPAVTTTIHLSDENAGRYLADGSIFFRWNSVSKQVDLDSDEGSPTRLYYERVDPSKFIVALISDAPR